MAGIGWTEDGMNKFNDLYDSVKEDRMLHGVMFNNQLLKVFLELQRVVKQNRAAMSSGVCISVGLQGSTTKRRTLVVHNEIGYISH